MNLVDTHQHLWDLKQFPYSWCSGIPALNRSFLFSDYATAAEGKLIWLPTMLGAAVKDHSIHKRAGI